MKMATRFFNKLTEIFKDWLSKRLPDCRDITPTIGESLDRHLGFRERVVVKLHMFTCDRCVRYLEQIGFLKDALHVHGEQIADPEPASSVELREESKAKLKQMLAEATQ
jgi:hypothetical protein